MSQYNFKKIKFTDGQLGSQDELVRTILAKAFKVGLVVMRRKTWELLVNTIGYRMSTASYENTRFVIINERDQRGATCDTHPNFVRRLGFTYSEYNLMTPEIQERTFGRYWRPDLPNHTQDVLMISGDSPMTEFKVDYPEHVFNNVVVESIYSVTTRGYIGLNGDVICPIPEDFKHFQEKTRGNVLAMGYKTWHSIPNKDKFILGNGDPEKIRRIVIIQGREGDFRTDGDDNLVDVWGMSPEAKQHVRSLCLPLADELIARIRSAFSNQCGDVFGDCKLIICGGAKIYEKYASIVDTIHETLVISTKEGDVKLPANVRKGFEYLPGDPTFYTSKNMEVYRFMTWVRTS